MRILVTGGSGVLGRVTVPRLEAAGHEVLAPSSAELDLLGSGLPAESFEGFGAVFHLATRIPGRDRAGDPGAWADNDRLRAEATPLLVDAALLGGVSVFVIPTITFVYPEGEVDESDPPAEPVAPNLRSALAAEREVARFDRSGGCGVILRLGLLHGPGTGSDEPVDVYGATLEIGAAGAALAAAPSVPGGIYNVVDDGGRVSNELYKRTAGWRP